MAVLREVESEEVGMLMQRIIERQRVMASQGAIKLKKLSQALQRSSGSRLPSEALQPSDLDERVAASFARQLSMETIAGDASRQARRLLHVLARARRSSVDLTPLMPDPVIEAGLTLLDSFTTLAEQSELTNWIRHQLTLATRNAQRDRIEGGMVENASAHRAEVVSIFQSHGAMPAEQSPETSSLDLTGGVDVPLALQRARGARMRSGSTHSLQT
jgi:hypothetical protein